MFLRTLGGLSIQAGAGDPQPPQLTPRRLALLALVAAAGPRGITRAKILGILWPETEEENARHTLSQTMYLLRRETGREWITGTTQLRLDPGIKADIAEFRDALNADDLARAADVYKGPFLEGFYLAGAPEFEEWVEEVRASLHFAMLRALEMLASRASDSGDLGEALAWWRRLGEMDRFSGAYAAGQIRTLMAAGDHGSALRFAREYESRLRRELDAEPDPAIASLITQLRAAPPAVATSSPPPPPAAATVTAVSEPSRAKPPLSRRRTLWVGAALAGVLTTAAIVWRVGESRSPVNEAPPFLAIGSIRSRDTTALGPVLRDMLATNLARMGGVQVVSNSRLLELLPRGQDTSRTATTDAARRAGANQIVEGEVGLAGSGLILTLRRVALESGVVRQGYTVRAADPYALVDSATAVIARDLGLEPPADAVATVRTSSAIAYVLYEQGLREFSSGDAHAALRLMNAALERDSTFAMAAYFAWMSSRLVNRYDEQSRLLPIVRRLATRTVDRERLWIQSVVSRAFGSLEEQAAIAREFTTRFPSDPDAHMALGFAHEMAGNWAASIAAFNRAIAIDSVAGATNAAYCRVCEAITGISRVYLWWDSAAAAERASRRLTRFPPGIASVGWGGLVEPLLRQGKRAEAVAALDSAARLRGMRQDFRSLLDRDLIRWGRSDELEQRLVAEFTTAAPDPSNERPWLLVFALRNQGRLREAQRLATEREVPPSNGRLSDPPDRLSAAVIALEAGRPRESASFFMKEIAALRADTAPLGVKSRMMAWYMTLAGTAFAAAGDTAQVRALADSVERVGAHSGFGRDTRLHHFLRGLLLQRENRHAEAVDAFRRSLFSPTDGYTRTNLEMARSLMALRRYPEAVAALQPAVRGGVDGSNTYVTHTELHEALARAFDAAGQRDSAAHYYAAVARSWRSADPEFAARFRAARAKATPTPHI